MWYKVLERERYKWPFQIEDEYLCVNVKLLEKLLAGFNPWEKGHKKLNYSCI